MASRINDNVRTEWDSIDFENDELKEHKASPTKKAAKDRDEVSTVKDNAKNSILSGQKARKSPVRKDQSEPSDSSQEHTGLTQDCITLEPGASIQVKYPQLSAQDRRQQYRRNISPIKVSKTSGTAEVSKGLGKDDPKKRVSAILAVDGISNQNPSKARDESLIDESDQEAVIDDQKLASTVDETDESLTDDDESNLGSPAVIVPKGIRLPIDSDDEEFKAAKEKRVRTYAKNGQLSNIQSPVYKVKQQKQAFINGRQDNPINLVSSSIPSTPADYGLSGHSSMPPPVQLKPAIISTAKKEQLPIKGNQIPIPVSSSTEPSQNSRSSKPENVQVQRTPTRTKTRDYDVYDNHINLISYPSLPSITSNSVNSEPKLSLEEKNSPAVLPPSPPKTHISTLQTNNSPRKHPRSPLGSGREISSSPRKRQRLDNPGIMLPREQNFQPASMVTTSSLDPHHFQATNSVSQHLSPQRSLKSTPTTPGNAGTKSPARYQPAQSKHPTPTKPGTPGQGQIRSPRKIINFDHTLPQISASQPVPERPRVHQAAQAPIMGLSPRTKTSSSELTRQAMTANEEVSNPSQLTSSGLPELNLEPFTKILDLQSVDYCMAVQNNRIYSGLQSLFCEFLAAHLTYLGNMEHLFNLCIWLLRSVVDPQQQKSIEEEFWDDFILQHQQGNYDAYVQRCLAKFRQPGSWTNWYQQAQKNKLPTNVVTVARLESILSGKEIAVPKRNIPLLWSRFTNANPAKVRGNN